MFCRTFFSEPPIEERSISNLRQVIMSWSHWLKVGEATSLHLSRIAHLVRSKAKVTICCSLNAKCGSPQAAMPNRASVGLGMKSLHNILDRVLKTLFQNICILGHSQYMWKRVPSLVLHLSQIGLELGWKLDSSVLDMWARWTILNWSRQCLAQSEVLCIARNIVSHWSSDKGPRSCSQADLILSRDGCYNIDMFLLGLSKLMR